MVKIIKISTKFVHPATVWRDQKFWPGPGPDHGQDKKYDGTGTWTRFGQEPGPGPGPDHGQDKKYDRTGT